MLDDDIVFRCERKDVQQDGVGRVHVQLLQAFVQMYAAGRSVIASVLRVLSLLLLAC